MGIAQEAQGMSSVVCFSSFPLLYPSLYCPSACRLGAETPVGALAAAAAHSVPGGRRGEGEAGWIQRRGRTGGIRAG